MDKHKIDTEAIETMELFSQKIDRATPCAENPSHNSARVSARAEEKIKRAVTAAAERAQRPQAKHRKP